MSKQSFEQMNDELCKSLENVFDEHADKKHYQFLRMSRKKFVQVVSEILIKAKYFE